MKTIEKNKSYIDNYSNVIFITNIENDYIYYSSNTKKHGLIDCNGRYFIKNSVYHKNLKQIK